MGMDEADEFPPVSVPQRGWASGLQWEVCDYVQMIEAEHRRCLEDAQLDNETAGEPPPWEEKRCRPPRGPTSLHSMSPDTHHTH